jgi:hypothetical protein
MKRFGQEMDEAALCAVLALFALGAEGLALWMLQYEPQGTAQAASLSETAILSALTYLAVTGTCYWLAAKSAVQEI